MTESMLCLRLGGLIAAAASVLPTLAAAATVDLHSTRFDRSQLSAAQAMAELSGAASTLNVETFRGIQGLGTRSNGTANPKHTKVGSFTAFGECRQRPGEVGDGGKLQVRADTACPGAATAPIANVPLGGNWLDSNDNLGMQAGISGASGKFNAVAFFVTDAADVGGKFSVKVGGTLSRHRRRPAASSPTATSTS